MIQEYFGVEEYKAYKGKSIRVPLERCAGQIIEVQEEGTILELDDLKKAFNSFFKGSALEEGAFWLCAAIENEKGDDTIQACITRLEIDHKLQFRKRKTTGYYQTSLID